MCKESGFDSEKKIVKDVFRREKCIFDLYRMIVRCDKKIKLLQIELGRLPLTADPGPPVFWAGP